MGQHAWGLEVVKGRELGRVYPVGPGSVVLGNALDGTPGIDLGPQEVNSPRRMAPRQARLDCTPAGLVLADLDSPGGTFVNRQRVLGGRDRALADGDVIQLGGVQLKVVAAAVKAATTPKPPPLPPPPAPPAANAPPAVPGGPFRMATGTTCRTWDDFLTASSQSWAALRDELTSGRLAAYVSAQGRQDLLPRPAGPGQTDDDRLDDWLGRLPTTRPASAAMEVHPTTLRVRALPGGGVSRLTLRVTNTGYRLLRNRVRVESSGAGWVSVPAAYTSGPFRTAEETEVPVEVTVPPVLNAPRVTALWVEGVGDGCRVEIRVEPGAGSGPEPPPPPSRSSAVPVATLLDRLGAVPLGLRLPAFVVVGVALRGLVALGDLLSAGASEAGAVGPGLGGPAALFAALGAAAGGLLAFRHGEPRDVPPSAFAGGLGGVVGASLLVAACRSVEPLLGAAGGYLVVDLALWGGLGALAARAVQVRVRP